MPEPLIAGLPPFLDLDGGCTIRVTALDPTTGATVTGITVSDVSFMVRDLTGGAGVGLDFGPFMLVPGPGA